MEKVQYWIAATNSIIRWRIAPFRQRSRFAGKGLAALAAEKGVIHSWSRGSQFTRLRMSFVSGTTDTEAAQKFLEVLQNDFRNLSLETKKKFPQIKEVGCCGGWLWAVLCTHVWHAAFGSGNMHGNKRKRAATRSNIQPPSAIWCLGWVRCTNG